MISSSLIRPLVAPLVPRRIPATRRASSAVSGSRLLATALAVSALVAAGAPDEAQLAQAAGAPAKIARTAHKPPKVEAPRPAWAAPAEVCVLCRRTELPAPTEAAEFEHEAVTALLELHRRRHGMPAGPGLSRGKHVDRLLQASDLATFLRFGSARILAAQPHC